MIRLPKYPKFGKGDQARRVQAIAARAGVDLAAFAGQSCVVAGSNGKGGTAAMAASMLTETGVRAGLFTSPHLFEINERFAIDGVAISDAALDAHWRRIEGAADSWLGAHEGETLGGFEFLFLIAASWFQEARCGACVWEAGIGGRHDVTRLVRAPLAAIVSLDLEHTALLGSTLEKIVLDKADVVARNGRLLLGETAAAFAPAIATHRPDVAIDCVAPQSWLRPPLAGPHQANNAALAARLAEEIAAATKDQIQAGLARVRWPGRLETIAADPPVVIDVGHTPAAIASALQGFRDLHPGARNVLVCGASIDKNAPGVVAALAPAFARVVATRARHKGRDAEEIAALARAANPTAAVASAATLEEARAQALRWARESAGAIYVAGGLFLAAEFKAVSEGRDPAALAFF